MSAFRQVALREVAQIERDIVDASAIDDGTLYVGLENVESGGRLVNVRPVDAGELLSSKFAFSGRHVLYGKLRPYLAKIARPDFEGICSTDILPVLPGPILDRGYLAWLLLSPEMVARANSRASGANLPRLSPNALAELQIPLPPLPEQRRIAEILDKADALRAKRRAALAQLDTLTQSIFLDMFGDPATNPNGWPVSELGEVAVKVTDGEHLNPEFSPSGMPLVMAGDVLHDGIDLEKAKAVEWDLGVRFRRKCDPEAGDLLLVSRGATIGRQCVVHTDHLFCLMGSVILIKPRSERVQSSFLSAYLKHPFVRAALYKTSGASAQQAIYLKDLRNLRVIVPPIDLQREFTRRAATVAEVKRGGFSSLEDLGVLFSSLQHRAFQGSV